MDNGPLVPELAKLAITPSEMPLDENARRHLVAWLRQMAEELEKGEHFSTFVFTLGANARAKL